MSQTDSLSNNKRIAKNTLLLYFRMIIIMGVQLYTVRVILNTLGSSDYGLNNVVGGVVTMFAFLSSTMATASQRYFAYEIGKGNKDQLQKTFSMTLLIYCMIGVIILLLAETIGLWFLNNKMTIPPDRLTAANWVYQFAILSFILTMFQVPYDAMVIAHERMNIFAYVSILEVSMKLLIVYLLVILPSDKLITYAILGFCVTFIITSIYKTYCLRNFTESHFKYYWSKPLFKEITSYSGWNLFGAMASLMNNQGINIILNIFFGPVVNAARAIAFQVNTSLNQFVQNFLISTRPQITKYYAQGENDKMLKLVFQSSKFSFFLIFFFALPILFEIPFIFQIWLKNIPEYTVLFTRLIIIGALIDALSYPLMAAAQATGKIKGYQSIVGTTMLLNVPTSYILLKLGFEAEYVFYTAIVNSVVCLFIRLIMLRKMVGLSVSCFATKVILRIIPVAIISIVCVYLIKQLQLISYLEFTTIFISSFLFVFFSSYLIGLDNQERYLVKDQVNKLIKKIKK